MQELTKFWSKEGENTKNVLWRQGDEAMINTYSLQSCNTINIEHYLTEFRNESPQIPFLDANFYLTTEFIEKNTESVAGKQESDKQFVVTSNISKSAYDS